MRMSNVFLALKPCKAWTLGLYTVHMSPSEQDLLTGDV